MPRPVDFHLRSSCGRAGKQQTYPYHRWQPELSKHRSLHPAELLGLGTVSIFSLGRLSITEIPEVRANLCLIAVSAPLFIARGCSVIVGVLAIEVQKGSGGFYHRGPWPQTFTKRGWGTTRPLPFNGL